MSAVLFGDGRLDSQMALLFGNVSGPDRAPRMGLIDDENLRARGLCDWVQTRGMSEPGGIEGFVRMGFEVI